MKELLKNKKLVGVYILWVTFHFVLLLISLGTDDGSSNSAQGKFWPFSDQKFGKTYDYTEFLIYCAGSVAIIYAFTLIFPKEDENK